LGSGKGLVYKIMKTVSSLKEMFEFSRKVKDRGQTIALVPTMGALHEGHLSLITAAKKKADIVIVSIFVNPLQFGQNEDLKKYPRRLKDDQNKLKPFDPITIFTPGEKDFTPAALAAGIEVEILSKPLCGKARPGHFRGVATIVAKLFNITQPNYAFFGEKDYQQQLIIKKMTKDLSYNIEVFSLPTVREYDGLAMSSRNIYLNERERSAAPILYKALNHAKDIIEKGEKDARRINLIIAQLLGREPLVKIEYVGVVDPETLEETKEIKGKILIAIAANIGQTRLIDNLIVNAK